MQGARRGGRDRLGLGPGDRGRWVFGTDGDGRGCVSERASASFIICEEHVRILTQQLGFSWGKKKDTLVQGNQRQIGDLLASTSTFLYFSINSSSLPLTSRWSIHHYRRHERGAFFPTGSWGRAGQGRGSCPTARYWELRLCSYCHILLPTINLS